MLALPFSIFFFYLSFGRRLRLPLRILSLSVGCYLLSFFIYRSFFSENKLQTRGAITFARMGWQLLIPQLH